MKAEILSFDEVLDSIKSGNVKNIYIIDILSRFVRKVSDVEVEFLMQVREDSIFVFPAGAGVIPARAIL